MRDEGVEVLLQAEVLHVTGRSGDRRQTPSARGGFGKNV